MSMMPTSILGWGKEEGNESVSPWAAEKSASKRTEDESSESGGDNEPLEKKISKSPRTQDSAGFASPVSNTSRQGTMEDVNRRVQRRKTGNFTGLARKPDLVLEETNEKTGQRKIKSSTNLVPRSRSTHISGETRTRSNLDLSKDKSGASNFNPTSLMKGVSKLILRNGGGDAEGKPTSSSEEDVKAQSVPGTSPVSDDLDNDSENQRNLKPLRLSRGFGLHRERPKDNATGSKNKLTMTPAKESKIAQSKSKVAVDISKGLARSISSAARAPMDLMSDKSTAATSQARGRKNSVGKHQVLFNMSGKDKEVKAVKLRHSWFGFSREEPSSEDQRKRGPSRVRGKSKLRTQPSPTRPEKGTSSSHVKKKNPKGLDKVVDFAVDEYFDSDEDEMEAGGNVRSLAEDDFISYQTRHMRKGDRGRNR
ncbi:hypothetical protein FGB62_91g07 [Gracilaria domingensis]|nr:hypothetical protein FGB62_91g07 [Gracilaria domingensis]